MWYSQEAITPGRQPTNDRMITTAEVLPKAEGVQASHRAPQPGFPVPARRAPRTFGFEG